MKTIDFLDALRARYGLTSDYQLAGRLGVARQHLSRYRRGKSTFDDAMAIRVAELLEVDPGYVLACMAAERASRPAVRQAWERLAESLAVLALAVGAATLPLAERGLCITSTRRPPG